jgi:hypothetical protein
MPAPLTTALNRATPNCSPSPSSSSMQFPARTLPGYQGRTAEDPSIRPGAPNCAGQSRRRFGASRIPRPRTMPEVRAPPFAGLGKLGDESSVMVLRRGGSRRKEPGRALPAAV